MTNEFSEQLKNKITVALKEFETERSAILPIAHAIQEEFGWISPEHIEELEKSYGLNRVEFFEVLTFYSMYEKHSPLAKFKIRCCNNVSCNIMGGQKIVEKISKYIEQQKLKTGQSTFELELVPCLGVCGCAPALLINKDRHLNVTLEKIDEILNRYEEHTKPRGV